MDKISTIKRNILYFIEYQSIKKEDFYKNTGISASNFKGIGLNSEMSSDKIVKILSYYKEINPNWLLTGKGKMLIENKKINEINEPSESYIIDNKLILAHKKTIEVLETVVTDLRNDKELLHEIIKNCISNK